MAVRLLPQVWRKTMKNEKLIAKIVAVVSLGILLGAFALFCLWSLWIAIHWWSLVVVSVIVLIVALSWALTVLEYGL